MGDLALRHSGRPANPFTNVQRRSGAPGTATHASHRGGPSRHLRRMAPRGTTMPATHVTPDNHEIRVISIYATRWRHRQFSDGPPQPMHLGLGRLEEFYALFRGQLPQVIDRTPHAGGDLAFTGPDDIHPADDGAGPRASGPVTITRA